jgi:hypothetical protein
VSGSQQTGVERLATTQRKGKSQTLCKPKHAAPKSFFKLASTPAVKFRKCKVRRADPPFAKPAKGRPPAQIFRSMPATLVSVAKIFGMGHYFYAIALSAQRRKLS